MKLSHQGSKKSSQKHSPRGPDFIEILGEKIRSQLLEELGQNDLNPHSLHQEVSMNAGKNDSPSDSRSNPPGAQPYVKTTESSLLGQMNSQQFRLNFTATKYQEMKKPTPPRPAHQFNEAQKAALHYFKRHGFELAANFSMKDLKGAFRKIALKIHPDQGGESIEFQTLLLQREALELLFTPQQEPK